MKSKDAHWVCPSCRCENFVCNCPLEAMAILHKTIEKMTMSVDAKSIQEASLVVAAMDLLTHLAVDHSGREVPRKEGEAALDVLEALEAPKALSDEDSMRGDLRSKKK